MGSTFISSSIISKLYPSPQSSNARNFYNLGVQRSKLSLKQSSESLLSWVGWRGRPQYFLEFHLVKCWAGWLLEESSEAAAVSSVSPPPLISIIVCSKVTFLQKKLLDSLGMFYIYLVSEFPFLRGLSRFELFSLAHLKK